MAAKDSPRSNQDICLATLRDTDRDRYLACLLAPPEKRRPLAALYAFNAELARIRDLVHEPLPGEVRLQYWRDLLEGQSHGSTEANPLASELLNAIEAHRLPRATLVAMIEARIFDLYDDPMENRNALEGYAGETASALIQLAGLVLSPADAARSTDAAGHAGVAQMIAGCLLLMPLHRHRGQLYLPLDILSAVGLNRDSFLDGKDVVRITAAIDAFAGLGREHLEKARAAGPVPPAVMPAFLPVALAGPILRRAQKLGAAILDRPIQPSQWRRQLSMAIAAMRGKF
jgi:phytoene synthase